MLQSLFFQRPAFLEGRPRLAEIVITAWVLLLSYVAARLFSYLAERVVTRTKTTEGDSMQRRLAVALRTPLTFVLFLLGVWAAIHRLPIPLSWMRRLDSLLFVAGVVLLTLAASRAYGVLVAWYAVQQDERGERLAREFAPLFSKLGKVFLVLIGVITILQRFGVNVASLVVSLGVGSLALGLAAQDTLSNMFAGFTIMLDRPFRAGDRIQLSTGEIGDVETIGMRATQLRTPEDMLLIVPNSTLVRDRIVNQTRPSRAANARIEVGVAYDSDLDRVREVLLAAAAEAPHLDPDHPPVVLFTRFGQLSVEVATVFRVTDYKHLAASRSQVQQQIHRRFREERIEIPTVPRDAAPHAAAAAQAKEA